MVLLIPHEILDRPSWVVSFTCGCEQQIQLVPAPAQIPITSCVLSKYEPEAGDEFDQILTGRKMSSVFPIPKLPCSFHPQPHNVCCCIERSSVSRRERTRTCSLPQAISRHVLLQSKTSGKCTMPPDPGISTALSESVFNPSWP